MVLSSAGKTQGQDLWRVPRSIPRGRGGAMAERIHDHIRSNVVGYVALFIALSGTAYAIDGPLPGQNQVGSQDIINSEVRSEDIGGTQVRNSDLGLGAVTTGKIADGGVQTLDVLNNNLTGADVNEASLGRVPSARLWGAAGSRCGTGLRPPTALTRSTPERAGPRRSRRARARVTSSWARCTAGARPTRCRAGSRRLSCSVTATCCCGSATRPRRTSRPSTSAGASW